MEDSILAEKVAAGAQQELMGLVRWLLEHRDGDMGQLEEGLLERGHALLVGLLGTELPFAQAVHRLTKLCPVAEASVSQVEEVTEAVGRSLESEVLAEVGRAHAGHGGKQGLEAFALPQVEDRPEQLVIAIDGVMVPEQGGYHEVRTAAVAGSGLGERSEGWRYVVHTGDVQTFGRLVWCEAWRQGLESAQRVVVLGDGAEWIWRLAQWHFPGAVQVLDVWHATEHLWAAGKALFGETELKVAGWVEQGKQLLLRGRVLELLAEWEALAPQDSVVWAEQVRYLRNQSGRMRYDEYLQMGLPVGSGAVESANRHVVGVRVKQAGMRWSRAGVRGVLALRALLRSERWDAWWRHHPLPVPLAA